MYICFDLATFFFIVHSDFLFRFSFSYHLVWLESINTMMMTATTTTDSTYSNTAKT